MKLSGICRENVHVERDKYESKIDEVGRIHVSRQNLTGIAVQSSKTTTNTHIFENWGEWFFEFLGSFPPSALLRLVRYKHEKHVRVHVHQSTNTYEYIKVQTCTCTTTSKYKHVRIHQSKYIPNKFLAAINGIICHIIHHSISLKLLQNLLV